MKTKTQPQQAMNKMTLQDAKDIIAKKNGKKSWNIWGYEFSEPYGKEIPSKYLEEAAELYAKSMNYDLIKALSDIRILYGEKPIEEYLEPYKTAWKNIEQLIKQAEQK